ncbi:MAG TPA: hypothetical protein VFI83_07230 [Gaiella sp.]|nr:hypothetical protein [Gaiella sp.]
MEARALSALVATALARAWRPDSTLHGDEHWRCVAATGLALEPCVPDADRILVFCFGLLHDTRRLSDGLDPEHGARAAEFAAELRHAGPLALDDARFAVLAEALVSHSRGLVSDDPTTGACWDADRLHLPRVSIVPRPDLLSTRPARGEAPLAAAAALRADGPPSWDMLVESAARG